MYILYVLFAFVYLHFYCHCNRELLPTSCLSFSLDISILATFPHPNMLPPEYICIYAYFSPHSSSYFLCSSYISILSLHSNLCFIFSTSQHMVYIYICLFIQIRIFYIHLLYLFCIYIHIYILYFPYPNMFPMDYDYIRNLRPLQDLISCW